MRKTVALPGEMAACSGSHHAAPSDAMPTGHLSFVTNCAPATSLTFPATGTDQSATMVVFVINDGDTAVTFASNDDLMHIEGPDANDFQPDVYGISSVFASFNCHVDPSTPLPPHAWCQLALKFHPSVAGPKQATYVFAGGAGTLALSGTATAPPATFHADVSLTSFGYVGVGGTSLTLINDSASTVTLGSLMIDPLLFSASAVGCPATFTPGGACSGSLSVVFGAYGQPPHVADCSTTQLTSSMSTLSVPVSYAPAPAPFPMRFDVWLVGDGAGEVVSDVGGIGCTLGNAASPSCVHDAWQWPGSITLTAMPPAGSQFVGWFSFGDSVLLPCGNASTCTVALPSPSAFQQTRGDIEAWFASSIDKLVHITIVGSGSVAMLGEGWCTSSCTLATPPGRDVTLHPSTSGTFVGWSGDCTGTGECQLGTVINDRNVTATFSP